MPVAYRQDPCDSEMGFPPARADRRSHVYHNPQQGLVLKIRPAEVAVVFEREIAMLQIAAGNGLPVPVIHSLPVIKNGWVSYTLSYIEHQAAEQVEAVAAAEVVAQ